MHSLNKVTLIGNCGNDPDIKETQNGKRIANFTLATSESWSDKLSGERKERTEWHRIVVFNDALVNIISNYVKKGSKLYIEGALQTRKWQDKEGTERYTTEIVLQGFSSTLILLEKQNKENSSRELANFADDNDLNDKIPFT